MLILSSDVWLRRVSSGHAAGQETPDRQPERIPHRPDHGAAGAVRFGDHGIVGPVDPFSLEPDAVVTVPGFPIDVGDHGAVGNRAARSLPALEAVEPGLERRTGVAAVIAGHRTSGDNGGRNHQRYGG